MPSRLCSIRLLAVACCLALLATAANAQTYTFTTFAGTAGATGSADGTGPAAQFFGPNRCAIDSSGNVYLLDRWNSTIRKITPAGVVTTLAGMPGVTGSEDGTGSAARFDNPEGIAVDSSGNVFVADTLNNTIRRITPAGVVTTLAGTARVVGSADGTGAAAEFNSPRGLAIDSGGNLYVPDANNNTIRKITPAGVVTTFAGTPGVTGSADGTGAAAQFNIPECVTVDSSGNIYLGEVGNQTIRKITPAGVVTTLAGTPGQAGSADGTGAAARFNNPGALGTDSSGNVYVADYFNNTIRKITPAGVVTTIAGTAGQTGSTDGTGADVRFDGPVSAGVDSSGNVYVSDQNNHTIRKGTPAVAPPGISKSFGAASIPTNGTTSLSFTVSNPNASTILTGIGFSDTLPAGLVIATPNGQTGSSCGGSITAGPGTNVISLSGGTLAGGASCTFSVNVTATASGTKNNTTGAVTSVEGGTGGTASASLIVTPQAPTNLIASATTPTAVGVGWTASNDAVSYEIARSASGTNFSIIGTSATTSFSDTTANANTAYLYEARAVDGSGNRSPYSSPDLATTVMFTDEPLLTGTDLVKAMHLTQLRTAVQAVRTLAGLGAFGFNDPTITAGTTSVNAVHVTDLRSALNPARSTLGLSPLTFNDPTITSGTTVVSAIHFQQVRNGVR